MKCTSANILSSGEDPQFRFFGGVEGGAEVSPEPAGPPLPSAENNLHSEAAISATCPRSLQSHAGHPKGRPPSAGPGSVEGQTPSVLALHPRRGSASAAAGPTASPLPGRRGHTRPVRSRAPTPSSSLRRSGFRVLDRESAPHTSLTHGPNLATYVLNEKFYRF